VQFWVYENRSVAEVSCSLTLLMARSNEWKRQCPVYLFDGDVLQAFDFLTPALADNMMSEAAWPTKIRAATIDTNINLPATAGLPGCERVTFPFNKSLKIGSIEAPSIWRLTIYSIFAELVPLWHESGFGLILDATYDESGEVRRSDKLITHFVWADNIYLVARTYFMLQKMVQAVSAMLTDRGLFWKESSLRFMTSKDSTPQSFVLNTLNHEKKETAMIVKQVHEMEVLGSLIDSKGSTGAALSHRLVKASGALWKYHHLLFTRHNPLKERFLEWSRRIVPVVLHCCGGWCWSNDTYRKLHSWEGIELAKIVNVRRKPGENKLKWWCNRIIVARSRYRAMGHESLATKTLRRIFKFAQKTTWMGPDAMDHVVQLCASWRNRRWWEEQNNRRLGDWQYPRVGRVLRRWEDVFVEFRGLHWARIMSNDTRVWRSLEHAFVVSALDRVHCSCINVEIVQSLDFDIAELKVPRDLSLITCSATWYPKWDCERRIELLGDSKVVVNWSNGIWPVKNPRMKELVNDVRASPFRWWEWGVQPRKKHVGWSRHIFRELNTTADMLAGWGRKLQHDSFVVEASFKFDAFQDFDFAYVRGFWDGAYSDSEDFVGVGWYIEVANHLNGDEPDWISPPLVRGYGRCCGHSAIAAELLAHHCLVDCVDRCLLNLDVFEPYMPWRQDSPFATDNHDLKMDFIEVKGAREEIDVQGFDTSDSETSSSLSGSSMSSSLKETCNQLSQIPPHLETWDQNEEERQEIWEDLEH